MAEKVLPTVYYTAKCHACVRSWQVKTAIAPEFYITNCVCGGSLKLVKDKEQPTHVDA